MAKAVKKRNWSFVAYPESLPPDWLDRLQRTGLPFALSPLHEYDHNPTGEVKKPHYHVILCYPGPTTYAVVKALTDDLNQPIPIPLESVKGMYRYFCHLDNPEKYQYDTKLIRCFGGFDISQYAELTASEILQIKGRIVEIIREKNIIEYSSLIEYLIDEGYNDEWSVASNSTLFFEGYIRSRRHRGIRESKQRIKEFWDDVEHTNKTERDYIELYKEEYES